MICPVCRIEMIAVERSGIELDSCISCRGLWFDSGELALLAEMSGADLSTLGAGKPTGSRAKRRCPRCDRQLVEIALESIRIDRCPNRDGLWFDRGELGALVEHACSSTGNVAVISNFLGEVFSTRPDAGRDPSS